MKVRRPGRPSRHQVVVGITLVGLAATSVGVMLGSRTPELREPSQAETDEVRSRILIEARSSAPDVTDVAVASTLTVERWTVLTLRPLTGRDEGIAGLVVIGRFDEGRWRFARHGEPTFRAWLEALPNEVLSDDEKEWLR